MTTTSELSKKQTTFYRLLSYILPYRWRFGLGILASLGEAASNGAIARLVQPFIDRLIVAQDRDMARLVPLIIILIAAFKGASRYLQQYYTKTTGELVVRDIRNELHTHTLGLSMRYFSNTPIGTIISMVLNDVGVLQGSVSSIMVGGMREVATLVTLTGVAFYSDAKMAAIAFVALPLSGYPAYLIGKKIKGYSMRGQSAMGLLTKVLEQTFSGIRIVKSSATEEAESRNFQKRNRHYYHFVRKMVAYDAASSPVMEIISALGIATVLWYGMNRVMSGLMTQGELFSVLAAILLMYTPAKRLTGVHNNIQKAMGAAERIFSLMDTVPDVQEPKDPVVVGRISGEVTFQDVSFAYESELVVKHFDLVLNPGEVVALVGPSGSGKTTIAALMIRFYDPVNGMITVDGFDLRHMRRADIAANIAIVDQETFLFNDTVAANIAYGQSGQSELSMDRVVTAARKAYADEFITTLPDGYETVIGDRGVRLSGGQRQRLCIARAIYKDAPILILDEATSALDTESEAMVQQALNNLMANRSTLVIAHRLSTIQHADRIVVLENGRIVGVAPHRELLLQNDLYRRLYDMQFKQM